MRLFLLQVYRAYVTTVSWASGLLRGLFRLGTVKFCKQRPPATARHVTHKVTFMMCSLSIGRLAPSIPWPCNSKRPSNMNLSYRIILCCVAAAICCGVAGAFKISPAFEAHVTATTSTSSSLLAYQQYKRRRKSLLSATSISEESTITASLRQKRSEELFQERLSQLHEFRVEHGHGSIPTPYHPNPALGVWAANLRQQNVLRKQAERKSIEYKGYLTDERKNMLIKAGFDFTSLTERQFQIRIKELQEFKQRYGHTAVPEKYKDNMALGAWVSNLRSLYRRKLLTHDDTHETTDESFEEEKAKQRRRSRSLLRQTHHRVKRRRQPRFSHLNEDRIQMLEEIGFVWKNHDKRWFEMLEWAKTYGVANYLLSSESELNDSIETNYNKIVSELQDPRVTPTFRSQEEIKQMLLGEECILSVAEKSSQHLPPMQLNQTSESIESESVTEPLLQLDYSISPSDHQHQSLRIWMINQRSNYNRLHSSKSSSLLPSTMTDQRQEALEQIHFPWSGRHRHRLEEIQYLKVKEAERIREMEKLAKREAREREEQRKVEMLQSSIAASIISGDESGESDEEEDEEIDIMSLWDAEDDEDDW